MLKYLREMIDRENPGQTPAALAEAAREAAARLSDTAALSGALARWAEGWEHTPQGWAAHGFSEGLALVSSLPVKARIAGLMEDEARERLRVGCAAAGPICAPAYREAFEAGYRVGKTIGDTFFEYSCDRFGGE